jgi:hypothetical protein
MFYGLLIGAVLGLASPTVAQAPQPGDAKTSVGTEPEGQATTGWSGGRRRLGTVLRAVFCSRKGVQCSPPISLAF